MKKTRLIKFEDLFLLVVASFMFATFTGLIIQEASHRNRIGWEIFTGVGLLATGVLFSIPLQMIYYRKHGRFWGYEMKYLESDHQEYIHAKTNERAA